MATLSLLESSHCFHLISSQATLQRASQPPHESHDWLPVARRHVQ